MNFILILSVTLCLVVATPLKNNGRQYDPEENGIPKHRYMLMGDDSGRIHIVDLRKQPTGRSTGISDVTLYLYTQKNPNNADVIPVSDFDALLTSSHFDKNNDNMFIVHGWNNNGGSDVNELIKAAVLDTHNMNVFVVDWRGPANSFYTVAKAAVPVVGGFIGDFINQMISDVGISASKIFMSGHSLGAHICGAAGARTGGKVEVIVGLDAASPLFSVDDTDGRLDPSDARFVHVIHTNGGLLAFFSSIGDADYFPNGGRSQPGCGLDLLGICSHARSYQYFAESIYTSGFTAYYCSSQDSFEDGLCYNNHQSVLGNVKVDVRADGDYFLNTNSEEPFSLG